MNLPYVTITVSGSDAGTRLAGTSIPELPIACYATAPDAQGWMVFYPESLLDVPHLGDFVAAVLSSSFANGIAVLAVVDEDDNLRLRIFAGGSPVEEYIPQPGYAEGEELPPSGGNADRICSLLHIKDGQTIKDVADVLSAGRYDDVFGFGLAKERHSEIAELLGLPGASVSLGYDSLSRGIVPEDVSQGALRYLPIPDAYRNAGMQLRQYALFAPSESESEAQIAARFLPDVIAWEDDFLLEPTPTLGSAESVQSKILQSISSMPARNSQANNWIVVADENQDTIALDLGSEGNEATPAEVRIYSLTAEGRVPESFFTTLCEGTNWQVWDYRTRRVTR